MPLGGPGGQILDQQVGVRDQLCERIGGEINRQAPLSGVEILEKTRRGTPPTQRIARR
jgi:hypothetical protein